MHIRNAEPITATIGTHTNTQNHASAHYKPKNAFWIIPLMLFTVLSSMPQGALAFESTLAHSAAQRLEADIQLHHDVEDTIEPEARLAAAVAPASPITEEADWAEAPIRLASASNPNVYPTVDTPVVLEGEASYYSRAGCVSCGPLMISANGQPLNDNALTMAIGADRKHLVGHRARVTSLATGKSVEVTITDTGGFYKAKYGHRVADLTVATKTAIGMAGGVGQVRVEVY